MNLEKTPNACSVSTNGEPSQGVLPSELS